MRGDKMKKTILYTTLILFISCATSSPVLYKSLSDASYPKTTKVDVYKVEKPSQEFTEIGTLEIKMEAHKEDAMYAAVIAKAKQIGADGIILIKDEMLMELVQVPRSIDNRQGTDAMEKEFKHLVFTAIRYVDQK
jgi:PBP1b-binding outer membrane lipoprotein LpoB